MSQENVETVGGDGSTPTTGGRSTGLLGAERPRTSSGRPIFAAVDDGGVYRGHDEIRRSSRRWMRLREVSEVELAGLRRRWGIRSLVNRPG